jgi:ubiquinone/menaquinone biosynthesis methyltransferase
MQPSSGSTPRSASVSAGSAGPGLGLVPEIEGRKQGVEIAHAHAGAVRRMFDRISPTYDLLNRMLSFGIDQRWRRHALDTLERTLPPGPLLDLCAGTLDLSLALRRRFADRKIVSLDFARDMLLAGRPKLDSSALVVADAMHLPLRSSSLAGIVCGFGMRNLADPKRGLAEAHRVLAPGGTLVVLEFFRPTRLPTRVFHALYGRVVLPMLGRIVSGDGEAYRYLSRSMEGFLTVDEFSAAMREVGFREVQATDLTFGVATLVRGVR